ncbi:uncharacterized protein [Epargyreus clarus]|uniref:uncharacterized protein n=1 Tax=Epargyreus clarus TaxID=520877 RepID=UPI003C2D72C9
MCARVALAFAALAVFAPAAARYKPDATILIDVPPTQDSGEQEIEKRYTPELMLQLHEAKSDALLLYTEYCSKAADDLRSFFRNITTLAQSTLSSADYTLRSSPSNCRNAFQTKVHKIEVDAHKAATFTTENHHKFLLGHMIVFRMHLNKSEEYIKKCERTIRTCGVPCETLSKVVRWRRLALNEINRVRDDIEHSRKAYKDLIVHAFRRLNHLRKHVNTKLQIAAEKLQSCTQDPYQHDEPK